MALQYSSFGLQACDQLECNIDMYGTSSGFLQFLVT